MLIISGCESHDPDARYDSGYGDGYAAGYNTTCQIRSTIVEADWEDKDYTRGYNAGYSAGSDDCYAARNR